MRIRRSSARNVSSAGSSGRASGSSEGLRSGILAFIADYVSEQGYSPSLREIGVAVDRSPQTILAHLDRLEADGVLTRTPRTPRSLRLTGLR